MPALIDLSAVVILFGALIFCLLVVYIAKAFFGVTGSVLGKLPVIGGWIDSGLHDVEQKIVSTMSGAAAAVHSAIGAMLHEQARLVDWLGKEIARHGGLIAMIASHIPGVAQLAQLAELIYRLLHRTKAAEQAIHGIGHDVIPRVKQIERGIGHDVLPRIKTAEHVIGGVVTGDIPAIRARERALGRELDALGRWVHRHALVAGTGAFIGAVAWALAKLGAGWVRCDSASQFFKKRGCKAWNDLDALLALSLGVAASLSLVELAKAEQEVIEDVSTVVRRFWQV